MKNKQITSILISLVLVLTFFTSGVVLSNTGKAEAEKASAEEKHSDFHDILIEVVSSLVISVKSTSNNPVFFVITKNPPFS